MSNELEKLIYKYNKYKYKYKTSKKQQQLQMHGGSKDFKSTTEKIILNAIYKFNVEFNKVDTFIEMDADMSHNPNELIKNISIFKKKKLDLLISSRYLKKSKIINWPIKRKYFS